MKRIRMITALVLVLALGAALCGCGVVKIAKDPNESKYTVGDASFKDKVENIMIDWVSGAVTFAEHDGDTVDISEEISGTDDEKMRMRWWLDGTTLRIKYCESSLNLVSLDKIEKKLTVTLPKGMNLEGLDIDATSTAITGQNLNAKDLQVDFTSGSMDVSCVSDNVKIDATSASIIAQCEAKKIRIDMTSGQVDLTQKGSADSISMDATSGKIRASLERFNDLDIGATSADITLYLPEDLGFTADVDSTSGDVDCDFPAKMKNGSYTVGDGSAKINIDITSGDVVIRMAE